MLQGVAVQFRSQQGGQAQVFDGFEVRRLALSADLVGVLNGLNVFPQGNVQQLVQKGLPLDEQKRFTGTVQVKQGALPVEKNSAYRCLHAP